MNNFSKLLSDYFLKYLVNQKKASENTIKTYRDAFVLLLEFMESNRSIKAYKIKINDFSYEMINEFLNWLEEVKGVSISTRNNRLAAIKSFFRYVSYIDPEYLAICSSILNIQKKKCTTRTMNYLSIDAYIDFISGFNKNNFKDLRDLCVVVLLYESGARVSELINVRKRDLHLEKPYTVVLQGKGRKIRSVPLDYSVIKVLNKYIKKYNVSDEDFLFFNARRNKLTREGVNYILQKHFKIAKEKNKLLYPSTISPHCIRHSRAMHLLENGVNLIYIRDLLGHSSVTVTEIYSKANPEIKRKQILENATRIEIKDDYDEEEKENLLEWLKNSI